MGLVSQMMESEQEKIDTVIISTNKCGYRLRHLMLSLIDILPHSIKESKCSRVMDCLELTEMNESKYFMYLEEKKEEAYLYLGDRLGYGIQFQLLNVHTLEELKFNGNCIKYSRILLSFSEGFDTPEMQMAKHLISRIFDIPKMSKTKPFIDHMIHFNTCDNKIWVRHFEMKDSENLVEIGPRMTLSILKVFSGPCRGELLYSNPEYVSKHKLGVYERKISKKNAVREKTNIVPDVVDDSIFQK
eukprot:NODE_216_length_14242_cov_0.417592.p8 type:complete len:244 gc:universal NODE_216_length_14242_cov_0.417592:12290-13021(+)